MDTSELVAGYTSKLDADARQYIADLAVKQAAKRKIEFELTKLKGEVIKVLTGESTFGEAMIKELLLQKESELAEIRKIEENLQAEIKRIEIIKSTQMEISDELSNWSELFDKHDTARKKAMLFNIIDRIDVWKGSVEITYKIKLDTFMATRTLEINSEILEKDGKSLVSSDEMCHNESCIIGDSYIQAETVPNHLEVNKVREAFYTIKSGRQKTQ